jgi:hypothetical protein
MSDKERLEKFESYLNEFEHACRGGDYEASEHLKTLIIQTIEQQQQEIEKWKHMYETDFESYERLRDAIEQAQAKVKHLENTIKETLELLKRGGPGTRSKVQFKLEQVCDELEGDTQ